MANALAERGFTTTIVHFPTFTVEMKQAIGRDQVGEKLDAVKIPILMIDDIGAESMTSWIRDDVLSVILQYRMQEQLVTFLFQSRFKSFRRAFNRDATRRTRAAKSQTNYGTCALSVKEITMTGNDRRNG